MTVVVYQNPRFCSIVLVKPLGFFSFHELRLPKSEVLLYCFGKTAGFLLISKAAFTKRLILLMCFWYFSPVITAFSIIKIPKIGVHKSIFGIYFMKNCPGRVFFTKSAFPLDEFWYSAPCLRELQRRPVRQPVRYKR